MGTMRSMAAWSKLPSIMSVAMMPGATAFTVTPREAFIESLHQTSPPVRGGRLVVATLHGKGEAPCTLHLGGNTSKEGEMSFTFCDGAGNMLAKLAATIGADESGAPVLWIGGLQGAKPPLGRDEIVKATRELYGLRPKAAVMLVAQTVARMLGLTALRAPGNEGHISQRGFRRLRSKRKIYADYGQFWEEIGGTALAAEEYRIPVEPQVRDISEVKPHKRSEWKKRQALSEQLTRETLATLQALRLPAATE